MDWSFVLPDGFLGLGCGLLTLAPALIKDVKKERTEFDFDKQVQCIVGMLVVFAILLESHKFIENIYFKNVRVILIMVFVMQLVYRGGWCYDYLKEKRALTIKDVSMVSSAFQAEVTEIGSGRLFVKNIFIKVEDEWFPYSYPTSQAEEAVEVLIPRKILRNKEVHVKDVISFSAVPQLKEYEFEKPEVQPLLKAYGDLNVHLAYEMSRLELESSISDEISKERLERFSKLWYQAESLVCRTCRYATICGWRKFPCIVVATREGKWNRSLLRETYPKDTEAIEQISKNDWNASAAFGGLIMWYSKEAAEILGFEDAGAFIHCTIQAGELPAGCKLCSVEKEVIDSDESLSRILETYHTAGEAVSVEIQFARRAPVKKMIRLLDPNEVTRCLFDQRPFEIPKTI